MNVANNNKLMNIIDMHVEKYAPVTEAGSSTGEKNYYSLSHIGCDETGSGDFFGPLCVVACYIDERDYDWLMSLNIRDPKLMTPQEVIDIAREIKDRLVYSLLILDNSHYNQMAAAGHNLANIKAKLYNQAVTNVMQKVAMKIDKKVVNQFVSPKTYYNYLKNEVIVVKDLSFEQKGEEQYLAIMCSSILSKYAFYQYFNNMSRSLKMKLPRGNTSSVVDHVAVTIAQKYGKKMLLKVTKTNMTNYKRIKDVI
ncbi:ribonuclease HIII [Faecalibacillus faecis]|uniref:ribonuclease HIII n=1 Tax=Faecalibacillus faecis TaxID=1982628 RepID=UPI000664B773|nr:ribonuclease HIII [Faecalibacillus faecis]KMV78799.1 ribonuclease HII [Coprobacillus sp. 8_1_38FAA]RGT62199.1 ribonuclease HIII [Coprobacillus sp. AF18-40]RGT86344.1 ribonuclease HIII [Coprobacillus sp. AF18-15LB]RHB08076.1 ribonuclease HIII [Coprobacillus sp. AM42-12AC]RHH12646.1 ribonuclease HIII [Coprobacillus sp. AM18-4LB-d2]RHP27655.1 ribonuclease HIII [Coprobacillus sp. AF34-1BH]